jgi:hypothetical protein
MLKALSFGRNAIGCKGRVIVVPSCHRRLLNLAFSSRQLVEAILQGRQSVELTATRLTELDLPLDWTEQHKLLAS